jgi:hypothetical protein
MATLHPMTTTQAGPPTGLDGGTTVNPARMYSAADRDTAYHVWVGPANRSYRKAAGLLGITHPTLLKWGERGCWEERANESAATSLGLAAREVDRIVQSLILQSQVPSTIALMEIVADPGHKRRDVAALALLALGGRPLPKAPTITATRTLGDGTQVAVKLSDLGPLTSAELAHYARTGELPAGTPPETDTE